MERFPLAGDINWMETTVQEVIKQEETTFPLAGDINWMETINSRPRRCIQTQFPLAGDINWMETQYKDDLAFVENHQIPTRWGY